MIEKIRQGKGLVFIVAFALVAFIWTGIHFANKEEQVKFPVDTTATTDSLNQLIMMQQIDLVRYEIIMERLYDKDSVLYEELLQNLE